MKTKWVIATGDRKVPKEGSPREYIASTPVQVPASSYYLRRLADAELVEVAPPAASVVALNPKSAEVK